MRYSLSELLDIPSLQILLEKFTGISGMVSSILDPEGKILLAVGWQDICTKYHRVCPETECRCQQSDNYLQDHLYEKPYIIYKCLNGFYDCAIPIIVDNQHIGSFFTGQFLASPPDEEFFRLQARKYGFDEPAYIEALHQVPIISEQQVKLILEFYTELAQILSAMGLQRMNQLEAMDEKVRASEERLRLALEGSNSGIWDWNLTTGVCYYSPSWYRMLGYSEGDLEPTLESWQSLIHEDDRAYVLKQIDEHVQGVTCQYDAEYRLLTKSGKWRWVQVVGKVAARDENHRALRINGLTTDIDKRKRAERQLQEERNFNAALIDAAGDLITVTDQEGRIVLFNQVCEQTTGFSFEEMKGKFVWELIPPEDIEIARSLIDCYKLTWNVPGLKKKFEHQLLTKSGERRLICWTITFLVRANGTNSFAICAGTDITQQRIIEEKLRKSEAEMRSLFQNACGVIYTVSSDGIMTFVSHGWTETLGHDVNDVIGQPFDRFIHPDDLHLCLEFFDRVKTTGEPQKGVEYRVIHNDGSWRWHTSSGAAVKDEDGNQLYYVGVAVDISERRQAIEAHREYERRFRETLENIKLVTAILDDHNRLTFCNDFLLQLSGWKREEIVGRDWFDTFVPSSMRGQAREIISKQDLELNTTAYFGESDLVTKSGETRSFLWNVTLLLNLDGSKAGLSIIGEDITERRAAEMRSRELMQELETVNRELKDFAYIVSHDLKAPLRGIRSLAEWIYADNYDKFDEIGKEQLNLLVNRSTRMHNLLEGILDYSRLSISEERRSLVDLNQVITEVIEMLAPPDHISIMVEDELPEICFERTRIIQVFENLISNAIKYMDKPRGEIRIACQNHGDYWQFSVRDNGPGIAEKYFEKIFTIFQTLKPRDEFESTGVGLTIVKKIVGIYGGRVWLESVVGEGTTFHFTLPLFNNN